MSLSPSHRLTNTANYAFLLMSGFFKFSRILQIFLQGVQIQKVFAARSNRRQLSTYHQPPKGCHGQSAVRSVSLIVSYACFSVRMGGNLVSLIRSPPLIFFEYPHKTEPMENPKLLQFSWQFPLLHLYFLVQ